MSKYDYTDPGEDPAYCNGLGGRPGIQRHCAECGDVVYVDREGNYLVRVICQRCEDAQSVSKGRD